MIQKLFIFFAALLMWAAAFGCSEGKIEDDENGGSDGDSDGDGDGDGDGNGNGNSNGDFEVCEKFETGLESLATRVMILEDKSLSMNDNNKWNLAMDAIKSMVNRFDSEISFGLDLFNRSNNNSGIGGGTSAMCTVGDSVLLDVSLKNGDEILRRLRNFSPSNATPLLLAMRNYNDANYAPVFMNRRANSYLVIISDGMDTCGTNGVYSQNGGASARQLAQAAENIRTERGIRTIVIGFGEGANPEQLDAIAAAGGTKFDTHFDAADGDELAKALNTIAEAVVVSCQFDLGNLDRSSLDLDLVNVYFDDDPVPRDDGCNKGTGWTWMDDERTAIEFCKEPCKDIENEKVDELRMEIACSDEDVNVV